MSLCTCVEFQELNKESLLIESESGSRPSVALEDDRIIDLGFGSFDVFSVICFTRVNF